MPCFRFPLCIGYKYVTVVFFINDSFAEGLAGIGVQIWIRLARPLVIAPVDKLLKLEPLRWVASSFRTVRAVWTNYAALFANFSKVSHDDGLDVKDKAQSV